ncbi:MAG: alkaline phosphatase [Candidatus Competibacterales bacterium]
MCSHHHPLAKNVILMIADGIGFNAWLAADYYSAGHPLPWQYQNDRWHRGRRVAVTRSALSTGALNYLAADGGVLRHNGESGRAPSGAVRRHGRYVTHPQGYDPEAMWRDFSYAMANDYRGVDANGRPLTYTSYTDSAAAATALYTGTNTTNGRVATDPDGEWLVTLAEHFAAKGKGTGCVSSVYVSHATPGVVAAHNLHRQQLAAIAHHMIEGGVLDVILAPGHPYFDDAGQPVPHPDPARFALVGGQPLFERLQRGDHPRWAFAETREAFETLATHPKPPPRLVGIPQVHHTLQYHRPWTGPKTPLPHLPTGRGPNPGVPELATLTQVALNVLHQHAKGFFLMVEGGAGDWANHHNRLDAMVEEQIAFCRAADRAVAWVEAHSSWDETLLIVTADHECGGLWGAGTYHTPEGGHWHPGGGQFQAFCPVENRGPGELPPHQYASAHHTNQLVPLFALGAGSEAFAGTDKARDLAAAALWGDAMGWRGHYCDNTTVAEVVRPSATVTQVADHIDPSPLLPSSP